MNGMENKKTGKGRGSIKGDMSPPTKRGADAPATHYTRILDCIYIGK